MGVETCIAELSKGKHDDEEGAMASLLYHQNSTRKADDEGPNVYSGDLTVPGFPSMAPKGTGDDRVLSHKKVIQNMLAAAEERITQAVARRAAQVGAQSSAPGTGAGTPAGAGATETGRISCHKRFVYSYFLNKNST